MMASFIVPAAPERETSAGQREEWEADERPEPELVRAASFRLGPRSRVSGSPPTSRPLYRRNGTRMQAALGISVLPVPGDHRWAKPLMSRPASPWSLHPQLVRDTVSVGDLALARV